VTTTDDRDLTIPATPVAPAVPEVPAPPEPRPRPRALPLRRGPAPPGGDDAIRRLDPVIDAAQRLRIDTTEAETVRAEVRDRLANPDDAYVLALIGGTGVGKSSLLNALAGREVSAEGVRRPTTGEPVAWVGREAERSARRLLARLGVGDVRLHDAPDYRDVVLVDLPDIDSLSADHRRRVEEILPRVDAVAWVTDPEKYADALLHDDFLARWLPRLGRQVVILNKVDRLDEGAVGRVLDDLARRVGVLRGERRVRVLPASARGGRDGIRSVEAWLRESAEAKRVVLDRLRAAAGHAVGEVARAAGVDTDGAPRPIVEPGERRATLEAVADELLRIVDLSGARRQAVQATRAQARRRGTGPLGLVTSGIDRLIGRHARVADPVGYLARWKDRGPTERATEPVRATVMGAIPRVPPAIRPRLASAADPAALGRRLAAAVDAALPQPGSLPPPSSRLWPLLGLLQTVTLVATVVAVAWIVLWFIFRPPVESLELPLVGPVPAPLALLLGALAAGYVLARAVGWHAGWRGRRWAGAVADEVRRAVRSAVDREAFAAVDTLDVDRRSLWQAAHGPLPEHDPT